MRNKDIYSSYQWVIKVIESCKTDDHFWNACILKDLWYNQYFQPPTYTKRSISERNTASLLYEDITNKLLQKI